jgi:hypothetical protein
MATTRTHQTPVIYVTDQLTLTRHAAVDMYVTDGTAWIVTRCGSELPHHGTVNVSLTEAGWWAGCSECGVGGATRFASYLDGLSWGELDALPETRHPRYWDGHRMVAHQSTSCNCADCAE